MLSSIYDTIITGVPKELTPDERGAFTQPGNRNYQSPFYEYRTDPYRSSGRGRSRTREDAAVYHYEDEDQSTGMALKLGMRVRHPQFGVGTVLSVEALDDDTKLVVRFAAVGQKTLRAKYARLEPA